MSTRDPYRSLLRGCRLPRPPPRTNSSPPPPAPSSSASLPTELDFFNSPAPTSQISKPSPSPSSSNTSPSSPLKSFPAEISHPPLLSALSTLNVTAPTKIQRRGIPQILENPTTMCIAPTGSGKTLMYILPFLQTMLTSTTSERRNGQPLCLILAPTRELGVQIGGVFGRLSNCGRIRVKTLCSKAAVAGMKGGCGMVDVVIGTPGRVREVIMAEEACVDFSKCEWVVLDEADELLGERFIGQTDVVMSKVKDGGKRVLVSATMEGWMDERVRAMFGEAKKVVVGGGAAGGAAGVEGFGERVQQKFLFVGGRGEQGKVMAMKRMLREGEISLPVLVFVKTRDRARALFRELVYEGVAVEGIWGGRSGKGRERAVKGFREGKIWVLIATDLVGRGLDFLGVRWVVNYDVPETKEVYVHRCGRTGRNGRSGGVVTLWTEDDVEALRGAVGKVAKAMGAEMPKLGNGNAKKRKRSAGGRDGGGQRRAKKARFGGGKDGNKRGAGVEL